MRFIDEDEEFTTPEEVRDSKKKKKKKKIGFDQLSKEMSLAAFGPSGERTRTDIKTPIHSTPITYKDLGSMDLFKKKNVSSSMEGNESEGNWSERIVSFKKDSDLFKHFVDVDIEATPTPKFEQTILPHYYDFKDDPYNAKKLKSMIKHEKKLKNAKRYQSQKDLKFGQMFPEEPEKKRQNIDFLNIQSTPNTPVVKRRGRPKKGDGLEERQQQGPIGMFSELYKLIAARKAGNDNPKILLEINNLLKKLQRHKMSNGEKLMSKEKIKLLRKKYITHITT